MDSEEQQLQAAVHQSMRDNLNVAFPPLSAGAGGRSGPPPPAAAAATQELALVAGSAVGTGLVNRVGERVPSLHGLRVFGVSTAGAYEHQVGRSGLKRTTPSLPPSLHHRRVQLLPQRHHPVPVALRRVPAAAAQLQPRRL